MSGPCAHGCGATVEGPAGAFGLRYCDPCNTDSCLIPGPDGDGVCGLAAEGPVCHCCDTPIPDNTLTELCAECFYSLSSEGKALVMCTKHGYRFNPAHTQ